MYESCANIIGRNKQKFDSLRPKVAKKKKKKKRMKGETINSRQNVTKMIIHSIVKKSNEHEVCIRIELIRFIFHGMFHEASDTIERGL